MGSEIGKLFDTLTHGVYVIGVAAGDEINAFTAAWVMQASFDPPMLVLSINPKHSSYSLLRRGGIFTVNVLAASQADLAEHFGRPAAIDKLKDINLVSKHNSAPILSIALSYFECEVSHESRAGDHVLVIGRVINGRVLISAKQPMRYSDTGDMDGRSKLYPAAF